MFKLIATLMFLTLVAPVLAAPAMAADGESLLTGKTLIAGESVTVGDLFTNAGGSAGHVLAPTPVLGKKLVLTANDLQRVANAFKLNWHNTDFSLKLSLERDATLVQISDITDALAKSELKSAISENARFKISNLSDAVIVPGQTMPELQISHTAFDAATESFTAELTLLRDGTVLKTMNLSGIATAMVKIPVLKFAMTGNSVIADADITEIDFPKSQLRGDMIMAREELSGMITKRTTLANQEISRNDISPPLLIKRNDIVTVTYKNGPVVLSTKARSMGNGTRGDMMTFMNTTSKKPFEAKVTGPQQAEVNLNV